MKCPKCGEEMTLEPEGHDGYDDGGTVQRHLAVLTCDECEVTQAVEPQDD